MGAKTGIQWTGSTWTPIRARHRETGRIGWHCTKPSAGCKHCYAETLNKRIGTGLPFTVLAANEIELFLDERILMQPLHWRVPRNIFPCSMTDWAGEFVPESFMDAMFAIALIAKQHTYQFLTKRGDRVAEYIQAHRFEEINDAARRIHEKWKGLHHLGSQIAVLPTQSHGMVPGGYPVPNIQLGFSVENQEMFDKRWAEMRPLAERGWMVWCSYEPALGPLDVTGAAGLKWLVAGGESGPGARPFDIGWVRSLIRSKPAELALFIKQIGAAPFDVPRYRQEILWPEQVEWKSATEPKLRDRKGGNWDEWPSYLRVREYPQVLNNTSDATTAR